MKKLMIIVIIFFLGMIIICRVKVDQSNDVVLRSCYDYIIDKMREPQYWNEEQMVEYSTMQMQNEAKKVLVNGTGWQLVEDESDIIFKRGYQGELWLNFTKEEAYTYFLDEFQMWPTNKAYKYDLANEVITLIDLEDDNYNIDLTKQMIKNENDKNDRFNIYETISETFDYYKDDFIDKGCPIIGSSKDILEDYKHKMIIDNDKKHKLSDALFPWEYKDYIKDELIKLNKVEDIFTINRSKYSNDYLTYKSLEGKESIIYYYNPVFILFKDSSSFDKYKLKDPYTSSYFEHSLIYDNLISDFIMVYGNEVCKRIYDGEGCVYWLDSSQHPQIEEGTIKPQFGLNEESIKDLLINKDTILTIYYHPNNVLIGNVLVNDLYQDIVYRTFDYLNEVLFYYGKDVEVNDDYLEKFILYYNLDWQRMLGLR
ncbi:MAG: hypothetical protein PHP11_03325 [Erysipelotrichaceae bacterium]|nr:hypothetical protein [Erysipelotrichaceae bacterium]